MIQPTQIFVVDLHGVVQAPVIRILVTQGIQLLRLVCQAVAGEIWLNFVLFYIDLKPSVIPRQIIRTDSFQLIYARLQVHIQIVIHA